MEAIAKDRYDVKIRRVDIGSWSSDVARQHGIRRLPTLWLYEDGALVTKDMQEAATKLRAKP